mgnify:FL=1
MMQKESKIKPEFSTLSQTINILGSELGNVIKQQAGKSKYELVEEIRVCLLYTSPSPRDG